MHLARGTAGGSHLGKDEKGLGSDSENAGPDSAIRMGTRQFKKAHGTLRRSQGMPTMEAGLMGESTTGNALSERLVTIGDSMNRGQIKIER
jgi:hypothetical protein